MTRILVFATTLFLIVAPMLGARGGDPASATPSAEPGLTTSAGSEWVVAVNLVIWTGLFLYLLSLHSRIRNLEKNP